MDFRRGTEPADASMSASFSASLRQPEGDSGLEKRFCVSGGPVGKLDSQIAAQLRGGVHVLEILAQTRVAVPRQ